MTPLLLRQNKSSFKDMALTRTTILLSTEAANKYENLAYGMVLMKVWFYFHFIYFDIDLFYSQLATRSPYPTFLDNKEEPWGLALCPERQ